MLASIIEVIELSRGVVMTEPDNAKLADCNNNTAKVLKFVQSLARLPRKIREVAKPRIKVLDTQVKSADTQYGKVAKLKKVQAHLTTRGEELTTPCMANELGYRPFWRVSVCRLQILCPYPRRLDPS